LPTSRQPARKGRLVVASVFSLFLVGAVFLYSWRPGHQTGPIAPGTTVTRTTSAPSVSVASSRRDTAPGGLVYDRRATAEESILPTLAANRVQTIEGKWHIIGPYDNTNKQAEGKAFAPELTLSLDSSDVGKGGMKVSWKEYPAFQLGLINYLGCES